MGSNLRTITTLPLNVSWKAILALVFPTVGTLVLALLDQLLSPSIDPTLKVALVGAVNSLLAAAGAYIGAPGHTVPARLEPSYERRDLHDVDGA